MTSKGILNRNEMLEKKQALERAELKTEAEKENHVKNSEASNKKYKEGEVKMAKERKIKNEMDEAKGKYETKMTMLKHELETFHKVGGKGQGGGGSDAAAEDAGIEGSSPEDDKYLPQTPAPFSLPDHITEAERELLKVIFGDDGQYMRVASLFLEPDCAIA